MACTIMGAVVSLDGFIADERGAVGPLFDWYGNGETEWRWSTSQDQPCRTTQASKDFVHAVNPQIGAVVIGRKLFDQTNGWSVVPAAGEHVFVVTHSPPTDWGIDRLSGMQRLLQMGTSRRLRRETMITG
ncbi:hypothetical protein ACFP2T_47595 [Plantactinospora solaniradicis]|uniref:Deaminase n=1 Tax=Plantactinospora solaniradicis TaxID=1723736 RepID=A0ABW1KQ65_9ACTN